MSHDARDTNNDGKVSFVEKVKDKLHLHHKDKDADYAKTATGHTSGLPTSTTSHSSGADLNHDGYISTGEKLASSGLGAGSGLAAGSALGSGGFHDSRDLNRDGHVSMGERLASSGVATGSSGFHDSRDLNRDGHVSMGERLASSGVATGSSGFHDSRDLNRDGHISTSERLASSGVATGSSGFHDSRDLNRDGHVSMGERLEHHIGAGGAQSEAVLRLHEEQLAVSKREALAGAVDIHKRVHEERVQETVPVKREEVFIERRPLSGIAEPGARISEQDEVVRMPLYREEIVTEKRIVPTEEVIIRKNELVENQTVGATLRSEYVETQQHTDGTFHTSGALDARDTNRDGHVSMGEKLKGDLMHNKTGAYNTTSGALDARDTNRDGHVSMGEKLKSADMRDSAFDARDRNLDGRVSAGEKLMDAAGMNPATRAARG